MMFLSGLEDRIMNLLNAVAMTHANRKSRRARADVTGVINANRLSKDIG